MFQIITVCLYFDRILGLCKIETCLLPLQLGVFFFFSFFYSISKSQIYPPHSLASPGHCHSLGLNCSDSCRISFSHCLLPLILCHMVTRAIFPNPASVSACSAFHAISNSFPQNRLNHLGCTGTSRSSSDEFPAHLLSSPATDHPVFQWCWARQPHPNNPLPSSTCFHCPLCPVPSSLLGLHRLSSISPHLVNISLTLCSYH